MQINNSTPSSTQNFGAAIFHKIPTDMQEVMKANKAFNRIASEQDILVTAKPRFKFSDPFGLRTPKADEKCFLEYKIGDSDTDFWGNGKPVATDSKLSAPLKEHVQTLLEILKLEDLFNRNLY